MEWVWLLVQLVLVFLISTRLREIGDGLFGALSGCVITSFGFGLGAPVLRWRWGSTVYFFSLRRPLTVFVLAFYPKWTGTAAQHLLGLCGRILSHLLLATLGLGLWYFVSWGSTFWLLVAIVNGVRTLRRMLPLYIRQENLNLVTEGGMVWRMLRGLPIEEGHTSIPMNAAYHDLLQAIGDSVGEAVLLAGAAIEWAYLGNEAQAERLYRGATALLHEPPLFLQARLQYLRLELAVARHDPTEASAALIDLERVFHAMNDTAGLRILPWARVLALLAAKDTEPAERAAALLHLDVNSAEPLPKVELLLLCARLERSEPEELHQWENDHRKDWETLRDAIGGIWIGRTLMHIHERRGEPEKAELGQRLLVAALYLHHHTFPSLADRSYLIDPYRDMLEAIKRSAVRDGNQWLLQRLDHLLRVPVAASQGWQSPAPKTTDWRDNLSKDLAASLAQSQREHQEKIDGRLWNAGWVLLVLNWVAFVVLGGAHRIWSQVQSNWANGSGWSEGVSLALAGNEVVAWSLGAIGTGACLSTLWGVSMLLPARRVLGRGIVLFLLALLPALAPLIGLIGYWLWEVITNPGNVFTK